MAIRRRTARECYEFFREHIAKLFAHALTDHYQLQIRRDARDPDARYTLAMSDAGLAPIPIETREHGKLFVYFAQALSVVRDADGLHRLITLQYWYRIQAAAGAREPALMRWDYERTLAADKHHCRHHLQQHGELAFGARPLDLDKAHVPTGWVTIESVLRFLIADLGVSPPCGEAWSTVLEESERAFFEEFADTRYIPHH
jgi:hypothetical protein